MPQHHETRLVPFTQKQMFDLVADVGKYPEFLPWCTGARILSQEKDSFNADVLIGYGFVREEFNSTVRLMPATRIDIGYERGPFEHLVNYWVFRDAGKKGMPQCEIEFFIDFNFRSRFLNATVGVVFEEAVRSMINAFERRAQSIYR